MARLLVVCAVAAERDAILAALPPGSPVEVLAGGVGPAEAAAATSAALAARPAGLVLSAGIGGGFAPLAPLDLAVASAIVFADLGAETGAGTGASGTGAGAAGGFAPASELGFGRERYDVDPQLAIELADVTGGRLGTVLTVATVTGTAASAARLVDRYPDALAEAMEGAGVAAAAVRHGTRFAELRAVSNVVGPRERDSWRIPDALAVLGGAVSALVSHTRGWTL